MDVPLCYLPVTVSGLSARLAPDLIAISADLSQDFAAAVRYLDNDGCSPAVVTEQSLWLAGRALAADSVIADLPRSPVGNAIEAEVSKVDVFGELTYEQLDLPSAASLPSLLEIFTRYDDYFNIQRYWPDDTSFRRRQLLRTVLAILPDLARCQVDASEISAILSAVAVALNMGATATRSESAGHEVPKPFPPEPFPPPKPFSLEPPRAEALYRWKVGHHLFNLFTANATECLFSCSSEGDAGACSEALRNAAVLLRGTTAAMWYSEGFPRALYSSYIRPTMADASGNASGFSGTDNLEFRFFKIAVAKAFEHLGVVFGIPIEWPEDLWEAAYMFCDTRQLDLEHHTLLAEKVVGHKPSLKQIRLMQQAGTPEAADDRPAIEALRDLAEEARSFKEQLL